MENKRSNTILFITGAFVSHHCWDEWRAYYENNGYKTIAPPWPGKEDDPKTIRAAQPNNGIASIRLADLINHYASIIAGLPEKPILIGHSLGGLLTQIFINRGLAASGIVIHSLAPKGIIPTQISFYRSTSKALGFFTSTRKAYLMSFSKWQYAFTNGMPLNAQQKGYEKFAIPESKLVLRDCLSNTAKIDFTKPHAPLLFIAGSTDHCIPASLNKTNADRYKAPDSIVTYKLFEGRNHFVLGQPTWKEEAAYILNWINT
jgi:pimeloyl-ACP methyl ester carboxylesterase